MSQLLETVRVPRQLILRTGGRGELKAAESLPLIGFINQKGALKVSEYSHELHLTRDALRKIDEKGIFLIEYSMPHIYMAENDDDFNSFQLTLPPPWAKLYEDDAGMVITRKDFWEILDFNKDRKTQSLAHELLHGIHDRTVMDFFENVTPDEFRRFKREFIKNQRHIGFVEGLMERLSRGETDWENIFNMMKREGIYDLSSLKNKMLALADGPDTPYNSSYLSAHAYVNGFSDYFLRNKTKIIKHLETKGIYLLSEYEKVREKYGYKKLSGEAILFRIVVEYMKRMFEQYRSGGQKAADFEIIFEEITGERFAGIEKFSWNNIVEKARLLGFEGDQIKKISVSLVI